MPDHPIAPDEALVRAEESITESIRSLTAERKRIRAVRATP